MVGRLTLVACLTLAVSCGGGGTTPPASPTEPTDVALTPAPIAAEAARGLFEAWRRGDRETAVFYATEEVADFLLNRVFPEDFVFLECLPSTRGEGREVCTFAGSFEVLDVTLAPHPDSGFRAEGADFHEKTSK